ncbi:MAG: pyridoxamine 5'-phosphate oxidase family protein [Candidatus Thorarchaeota archaeon]|nr:pyridoxamine 5'-phosphate oxidase family protein [Candidatus Thorarchaeota archaeon]
MEISPKVRTHIDSVLSSQEIAVLGTSKDDEPYSCLIAFAVTADLREMVFATMRQRLKYANIMANPRVTLIIDDRDAKASDFNDTTSITMVGTARDVKGNGRDQYAALLLRRHPKLVDFVNSPDCAVICVEIDKIYIVSEFESVVKIKA